VTTTNETLIYIYIYLNLSVVLYRSQLFWRYLHYPQEIYSKIYLWNKSNCKSNLYCTAMLLQPR